MPRKAVAGIVISIVAFVAVLGSVDVDRTLAVIGRASPVWVLVIASWIGVDILLRGLRWQRILAPIARVPVSRMLRYLLVGYLANNVLPVRLGELIRSHVLGDREGVPRATALGTVAVERLIDTVVVALLAVAALLTFGISGDLIGALALALAVVGGLSVVVALAVLAPRVPRTDGLRALLLRSPRALDRLEALRDGLRVAGNPSVVVESLALTAAAWTATMLAFFAAGQAFGVGLDVAQAAALASGVALAAAVPSGPSALGTSELAVVAVGSAVGLRVEEAFAIGLAVHAVVLAETSIGGLLSLRRVGSPALAEVRVRA